MNRLHIYLPLPLLQKLRKQVAKDQTSLSEFIRRAVEDKLQKK
jgi:metal-responsive CopG/Arc/MetJ family transcriptional regulator